LAARIELNDLPHFWQRKEGATGPHLFIKIKSLPNKYSALQLSDAVCSLSVRPWNWGGPDGWTY